MRSPCGSEAERRDGGVLLRAAGGDAFGAYHVFQAAIALRQGFGRLIRSRTDRGIVAILDKRIVTKSYGRQFLRSLPDCPRFPVLDSVERWWDSGVARLVE